MDSLTCVTVNLRMELTFVLIGTAGFEPATTCTPCKCATRLRYAPRIGENNVDVVMYAIPKEAAIFSSSAVARRMVS